MPGARRPRPAAPHRSPRNTWQRQVLPGISRGPCASDRGDRPRSTPGHLPPLMRRDSVTRARAARQHRGQGRGPFLRGGAARLHPPPSEKRQTPSLHGAQPRMQKPRAQSRAHRRQRRPHPRSRRRPAGPPLHVPEHPAYFRQQTQHLPAWRPAPQHPRAKPWAESPHRAPRARTPRATPCQLQSRGMPATLPPGLPRPRAHATLARLAS